jgi:hypothetical protein
MEIKQGGQNIEKRDGKHRAYNTPCRYSGAERKKASAASCQQGKEYSPKGQQGFAFLCGGLMRPVPYMLYKKPYKEYPAKDKTDSVGYRFRDTYQNSGNDEYGSFPSIKSPKEIPSKPDGKHECPNDQYSGGRNYVHDRTYQKYSGLVYEYKGRQESAHGIGKSLPPRIPWL